ncbi:hypothetical protein FOQG_05187 [Fusarium oxysporum f. sp. raphani 54005]|uniref:Uncharacterized protein n=8 Tax=Fusarium oxysporum TaxID=5507 RepID=W9HZN4_FUSOX|nr:hypothetical protein FOXG_20744 [Fusarium oxysporum f. sp. lycopersici 4287]EWY86450.1 hypothetical protein FOYG_10991 [Fusarium oxysporum NRRL 32931]EWZ32080.1 hypothetical protein FOZG_15064 [Fusarium oxysporum Fo47]EWZ94668.1 hypothetical protein FOWG_04888 [Fusarium oxysporum f. sp. lycopersici MN25]EXA39205.1 hypothetical protein FOVG_10826 [Fusarium oxysporum f. sp. pisi HDV247]EXK37888.1 hypothetical protein FOMG_08433 [Fusarium oxysporum f. sp. melonis 26406]EXK92939.1 hypothetical
MPVKHQLSSCPLKSWMIDWWRYCRRTGEEGSPVTVWVRERIGAMSRLVRASGLRTLVSPFRWNQHIGQK